MRLTILLGVVVMASQAHADAPPPPRQVRGEVVIIRDHAPGYKPAAPVKDPRIAPKYSAAAIEHDAWTRAWMLLDIDEHGVVQRVQFIKKPGYDLEKIALDRVFKSKFEPARDGMGRAEASHLVFPIEWPSYWWLVAYEGVTTRIPQTVGNIPCKGSGQPLNLDRAHAVYRDCSMPDLSKPSTEPWISRPR